IRLQIAQGVLDAGQEVLEQRRVPKDGRAVPQRAVEHAALLIRTDPGDGKILVRHPHRQNAPPGRKPRLVHVDAEQHVQMIAQDRLLELECLVGNLEFIAVKHGIQRALRVLHLHRHGFPIPGMSAVLVAPSIWPNGGHWSYLGYCTKVAMASWIPTNPLPPAMKPSSDFFNSGSSNKTPTVFRKQRASNCLI